MIVIQRIIKASLLSFVWSLGLVSILQSAEVEDEILSRSVFLYPRNTDQINGYDLEALGKPLELIYWAIGFRCNGEQILAYPKSCNPQDIPQPESLLINAVTNIRRLFERFPHSEGYRHTWMIDTCLVNHADLIKEGNLDPRFRNLSPKLINDIIQEINIIIQSSGYTPQAIAIDIEPICDHTGANSLLGFHADLVARINAELSLSVAVHLSCSKICDCQFTEPTSNELAKNEFLQLREVIISFPGNHFLIDAFCHGGSCEHQATGGPCTTINGREEESCEWQHFTSQKKLGIVSQYFKENNIPFKLEISISGSSSGGIVPEGWSIENFIKSISRIRKVITPSYGVALFGVGGEPGRTGNLQQIGNALDRLN
jgi:hypothetical protein